MKIFFAIIFSLFIFTSHAQVTWYVSTSGSNTNLGTTLDSPFLEINHALNKATCGDSIYVLKGDYEEKILAIAECPDNNRIIIQGDIDEKPTITGSSLVNNRYAIGANGAGFYFRHLKLTSPFPTECSQANQVIVGNGNHFTFDDITVYNSGYDGIKTYGDCNTNSYAYDWKIINSEIYDCGLGCPTSIVNGDGVDFTGCQHCLIKNTIIRDNQGHQLQIKLDAKNVTLSESHIEGKNMIQIGLPGNVAQCDVNNYNADSVFISNNVLIAKGDTSEFVFKLADVHHLMIHHNTVIKDSISHVNAGFICFGGCGGNASWANTPTAPIDIRNNIFANFSTTTFEYGLDTLFFDPYNAIDQVEMDYNLFYDVSSEITTSLDKGDNGIVKNPMFCNYPISFELQENSPCIDEGDPNSPLDPDNSTADIGAKYYQNLCPLSVVQSKETQNAIQLSPNPSSGKLYLQVETPGELKIINAQGHVVLSTNLVKGTKFIDISNFAAGLYSILFQTESKKYHYAKVVKL